MSVENGCEAVTIAGGGACAQAMAAYLSTLGHRVRVFELEEYADNVEPLLAGGAIHYQGAIGEGMVVPDLVTTDAQEGVRGSHWLLVTVPAYGHARFAEALAPFLEDGQIVVIHPGPAMGTFAFRRHLRASGCKADIVLVETHSITLSAKMKEPGKVRIGKLIGEVLYASLPSSDMARPWARAFPRIIPRARPVENVLAVALWSFNVMAHPAPVVLNAGRIEFASGDYRHYAEGITPAVGRVMDDLDSERRSLAAALGVEVVPHREVVADIFETGDPGRAPATTYEAYQSPLLEGETGPSMLDYRYLTEDLPFGLVAWVSLGERLGVSMPVSMALVTLGSALMGRDYMIEGRTLNDMGLDWIRSADDVVAASTGTRDGG